MLKATYGGVAQLGERTVRIRKVESSILFVSTNTESYPFWYGSVFFFCGRGSNRAVLRITQGIPEKVCPVFCFFIRGPL